MPWPLATILSRFNESQANSRNAEQLSKSIDLKLAALECFEVQTYTSHDGIREKSLEGHGHDELSQSSSVI
jgi:hypothetical protein